MEFNEIIGFEGGINTDDTPQGMPKGDYRDFSYCRLGYNSGNAYAVETSDGTLIIPNDGPDPILPQDQIIGATPWQKTNSIVYFVYKADLNHQIWVYDITNQTHTLALESPQLNFSREWPVYHANVIDDILKWTDGRWDPQMYEADGARLFNPPYQINLQKALDNYYGTIDLRTIDAIKWPLDPPRISYFTDPTRQDNKLRNKLFKFIIQPIYENGETGVWSMYSNLDLPEKSEFVSGTNWVYPNNSNGINIQFFTGPKIIRKFNIAVQQFNKDLFGTEPPFAVFLQLDKEQDNIPDNEYHTIQFYGSVATAPAVDVYKNYDRLPITSYCQEYLPTNQIVYTNFREGYDKPSELYEILDVQVDYKLNEITWNPVSAETAFWVGWNGVGDFDFSNAKTSTSPLEFDCNTVFPFSANDVISFASQNSELIVYVITEEDISNAIAWGAGNILLQNEYMFLLIGNEFADQLGYGIGTVASNIPSGYILYYVSATDPPKEGFLANVSRPAQTTPSLKSGATHEFGIVYGDRAYRDSTVYTVDSMNLFVPWFYDIDRSGLTDSENPFTINPEFTIDHIPPIWATKYWIVAKPATEIISFSQYTTNASYSLVSSIKLDDETDNRYVIYLDKYYLDKNKGASISHQISIGDKVRFIRRRPSETGTDPASVPYLPYLELDVIGYDPVGGPGQSQAIYVNIFDTSLIENDFASVNNQLFGQLLEIYTPRPAIDDTGSIFVSTWKDVTEAIEIRNPHTEDRAHGAPPKYYLTVGIPPEASGLAIYIGGDYTFLNGTNQDITIHYDDGSIGPPIGVTITAVKYNQSNNITTLVLSGVTPNVSMSYITFDNQYQVVDNLTSNVSAQFELSYGDVYVRQRNYRTGMDGSRFSYYYYIEDPNYSDYWASRIYNTGRTRIEDQNARMTPRQATAIHSDSFIVGTQINGLSSFALDNTNIEDMNPLFGPVIRTYMSGREGKTLKCLQPKKENSIYIQFYPNEVGSDSTVRVSNRTFASWFDYKSLYGCSDSGATAILPNGATMYFDNNSGTFIYSGGNGQIVVSEIDPGTNKDYKFRTKTKELAAAYNASTEPVVRTYVNETVGEVGFAFRFTAPYRGEAYGLYNPPLDLREAWVIRDIDTDYSFLYGQFMIIVHENGAVYSGTVNSVSIAPVGPPYTIFYLDTGGPSADEYDVPAYWYTTSGMAYDHVVFDYVNMRWRSTYDYNFQQFCNLGQTLVGWGVNNELYLHNQYGNWTFHGDPFVQKISFVSNEQPLRVKRYQDIALVSDFVFSVEAQSEPNRSYPLGMKTMMRENLINTYEGYGRVNYRKNLYDPRFFNDNNVSTTYYDPPSQPENGWTLNGDWSAYVGQMITIKQTGVGGDGNIYTGAILTATYVPLNDWTIVTLLDQQPGTNGVLGTWYFSEVALLNGEDIRANALTHTLTYDPAVNNESSILFSVGIKGVLS